MKGLLQQGIPRSHPVAPASGLRPPMHNSVTSLPDGMLQQSQSMSRGSTTERNFQNQHNREEQGSQVAANEDIEVLLYRFKFICNYVYVQTVSCFLWPLFWFCLVQKTLCTLRFSFTLFHLFWAITSKTIT